MTNSTSIGSTSTHHALAPDATTVKAARDAVARALDGVDRSLVESAVLATSELVTNAVLHARSEIDLAVTIDDFVVHVAISDASVSSPMLRGFDVDATTGRGLQILDVLASRWGVDHHELGKTVWFEIDRPDPDEEVDALVRVVLLGLPVAGYRAAAQAYEGIVREFRLIVAADPGRATASPGRVVELVEAFDAHLSVFVTDPAGAVHLAETAGESEVDLAYSLPRSVGMACGQLNDILDEAEAYCQEGEWLLSLVPPPEAIALRRWFLSEVARQCAGEPASRFDGSAAAGGRP